MSAKSKLELEKCHLTLKKDIEGFEALWHTYMPTVVRREETAPVLAESVELLLPSAVDLQHKDKMLDRLHEIEKSMRFSQASDALGNLRQALCIHAHLSRYKICQVRGQAANTRAQGFLDRAETRKRFAADQYRRAHAAFLSLAQKEEDEILKELKDHQIEPLQADVDAGPVAADRPREERLGEGQ
jgi:hypothetical protein